MHLLSDAQGLPLELALTGGQCHESRQAQPLLEDFYVFSVQGFLKTRPLAVAADKAYDVQRFRQYLRARGIKVVIPVKQRPAHHRPRRARPPVLDKELYRRRNGVERCIGWLKGCRRIATRYEKLALHFEAMVHLGMLRYYLKKLTSLSDTA